MSMTSVCGGKYIDDSLFENFPFLTANPKNDKYTSLKELTSKAKVFQHHFQLIKNLEKRVRFNIMRPMTA